MKVTRVHTIMWKLNDIGVCELKSTYFQWLNFNSLTPKNTKVAFVNCIKHITLIILLY